MHAATRTVSVPRSAMRGRQRVAGQDLRRPAAPAANRGGLRCACGGRCPGCVSDLAGSALRTPSQPLDAATRAFMEPHFGHDLGRVRVHDGAAAGQAAQALDAHAWTWGEHIVFGPGAYRPHSPKGAGLLAHELAHVVQQRGAVGPLPSERGTVGDAAERQADEHVHALATGARARPPLTAAATPRLQRSVLSGFLDVLLFIPRLFGAGGFPAEQLRDYLDGLKKRKGPAKTLFSDNKARACVSRESELGPYDTPTKIALVQDMLDGWTSGLDEDSIIALLRRSADRAQIVAAVGRDELWSNFSGGNRRTIEAITMTAADAGDALVSKLRTKDADEIQDYVSNATDPAVRAAAVKAAALARITAPVPVQANVDAAGRAALLINGVRVTVEPDRFDPSVGLHAFTHSDFRIPRMLEIPETAENANDRMGPQDPIEITLSLWTVYASAQARQGRSGYGVGTRPGDEPTLQAHERAHGQGWFDFLRDNPPPQFGARQGMSIAEYNVAARRWNADREDYIKRAGDFSLRAGDCVGTLPTDAQLAGTGYTAAICHTP